MICFDEVYEEFLLMLNVNEASTLTQPAFLRLLNEVPKCFLCDFINEDHDSENFFFQLVKTLFARRNYSGNLST